MYLKNGLIKEDSKKLDIREALKKYDFRELVKASFEYKAYYESEVYLKRQKEFETECDKLKRDFDIFTLALNMDVKEIKKTNLELEKEIEKPNLEIEKLQKEFEKLHKNLEKEELNDRFNDM